MIINPDSIAAIIADAPGWALVGLTAPRPTTREDAARELASHLYDRLFPVSGATETQLPLPL